MGIFDKIFGKKSKETEVKDVGTKRGSNKTKENQIAEDWVMFHHDLEHTGKTADVIENPENLELKWKSKIGLSAVASSPAISGNYVYVGSYDYYIYCLDKNTGEVKWKFKTGDYVTSSPAVSGNYVYIGSNDGYVYAFGK
jgi:outer membrane protein assembly factor BamB